MQLGLEAIALDAFTRRGEEDDAELHQRRLEAAIHHILGRSFGHDPELLGHVGHTHRLGRRDAQYYLHPRAPLFRFSHPALGLMDLAAREHANGTHFTLSYANHGLERRQSFQHERLSNHLFEGRFDAPPPTPPMMTSSMPSLALLAASGVTATCSRCRCMTTPTTPLLDTPRSASSKTGMPMLT